MNTEFEAYLIKKKIDPEYFKTKENAKWREWEASFEQLHPDSFTSQKLFLINAIRRAYPLRSEVSASQEETKSTVTSKPKFIRKKSN